MFKHECTDENASKFLTWITDRGGVAVWKSVDLSDPGYSVSTPALDSNGKPFEKPHWKLGSKPAFVVTDPNDIGVIRFKEVKRFHVAVRRGGNGRRFKLTDTSIRKLEAAVAKAGEHASYVFDHGTQEAIIIAPDGAVVSLSDWSKAVQP